MKKMFLALAAAGCFGLVAPAAVTPASAEVIVKRTTIIKRPLVRRPAFIVRRPPVLIGRRPALIVR